MITKALSILKKITSFIPVVVSDRITPLYILQSLEPNLFFSFNLPLIKNAVHCKTQTSLCSTHTPIFISVSPTHDFGRKRDLNHSDLVLKQRLILLCVDRFFRRCRPLRDKPFRHQKTGSDTKFVFFQISIRRNPCTRSKTVCSDYPTSPSDPKLVPVQFRDSLKPPEQ